jgi:hypothetical protein
MVQLATQTRVQLGLRPEVAAQNMQELLEVSIFFSIFRLNCKRILIRSTLAKKINSVTKRRLCQNHCRHSRKQQVLVQKAMGLHLRARMFLTDEQRIQIIQGPKKQGIRKGPKKMMEEYVISNICSNYN